MGVVDLLESFSGIFLFTFHNYLVTRSKTLIIKILIVASFHISLDAFAYILS